MMQDTGQLTIWYNSFRKRKKKVNAKEHMGQCFRRLSIAKKKTLEKEEVKEDKRENEDKTWKSLRTLY